MKLHSVRDPITNSSSDMFIFPKEVFEKYGGKEGIEAIITGHREYQKVLCKGSTVDESNGFIVAEGEERESLLLGYIQRMMYDYISYKEDFERHYSATTKNRDFFKHPKECPLGREKYRELKDFMDTFMKSPLLCMYFYASVGLTVIHGIDSDLVIRPDSYKSPLDEQTCDRARESVDGDYWLLKKEFSHVVKSMLLAVFEDYLVLVNNCENDGIIVGAMADISDVNPGTKIEHVHF